MAQAISCLALNTEARFALRSVHVGFVVDKVALVQVFLQVLQFSVVIIILPWLSMLIYDLEDE
jgi:hypothetical protein